nr:RNA-directed DNA polymerase, eukaryota, reverse transcriptase zinc-binding domain protein [Tanacetum cinerariifolium]
MREMNIDYGPTPFRFFHSWFEIKGFDKLVEDTWIHMDITDSNGMILLKKKLQALELIIREWTKKAKKCSYKKKRSIQSKLFDIDKIINQGGSNEEMAQKAKVRWAIEGDENSKPVSHRICLADVFNNQLSLEQQDDLERTVSIKEIKRAVWDCGINKSSGPDGFTFKFFQRYQKFLENDISVVIMEFFYSGTFPKGCNSSFIALIPKTQNAKSVKDFFPISLIGSLYKIIAKILANRLSSVIPDLISDVQSAFISNRQILDGPFIPNELLSWCKYKKLKAMIFKVDFEKDFDSIRWDYLDDVLKSFGFGDKWRLFTGISLDNSLTISHFFYADDAIFVGKWDSSNLEIIIKVLKCFHMASGLKININKSKLMGYYVHSDEVETTGRYIGCMTFVAPFSHLGVKVGGRMERINSWDDVVSKKGNLGAHGNIIRRSPWLDIIHEINVLRFKAEKINHPSLSWSYRREPRGGIEEEQQNMLFSRISGVILPNMRDRWIWSLEASGDFWVTSARHLIDDYLFPKGDVQTRWVKVVPIKINVFAWRVRLDKLPTRLNLSLRGVEISSIMCPLCNSSVESASHLFFTCHVARYLEESLAMVGSR